MESFTHTHSIFNNLQTKSDFLPLDSAQVTQAFLVYLSVAPTIDLPVSPLSVSVCMLLCKHAACIIRLERGSHWGRDNTSASHGCSKAPSRDPSALHKGLCEWTMRNVSAFKTFQHRSHEFSCRPKLGHAGPPELGQWGEGVREAMKHKGYWGEAEAPLNLAFLLFIFEIQRKTCVAKLEMQHTELIFMFYVLNVFLNVWQEVKSVMKVRVHHCDPHRFLSSLSPFDVASWGPVWSQIWCSYETVSVFLLMVSIAQN